MNSNCRMRNFVLNVSEEFVYDLDNSSCWGKLTILFFLTITDVIQVQIRWDEVQL